VYLLIGKLSLLHHLLSRRQRISKTKKSFVVTNMEPLLREDNNTNHEAVKIQLKGSEMKTLKGELISACRGIPYAKPPLGSLRFRRSEPLGPWEGVLDGTRESKKSYQPNVLSPQCALLQEGGEDCLYLNVYSKPGTKGKILPVVVFLHGGAFVVGSCESQLYGPQVLLDRDIVLVGVNYRLGPFGWLSLETEEAPGNLGLHDQYLALLWVRENISAFGGDPENVTLMGQSAGAMCALFHLVSPLTRGLFHKMIVLSGSSTSTFLHNDRTPRTYANALATRLGYCGDFEPGSVLTFLQEQKAWSIMRESTMFLDWDFANPMPWVPVLDDFCSQPMIPMSLKDAVEAGNVDRIPVIFGSCQDEGLILSAPFHKSAKYWELLRSDWEGWAPLIFLGRERDLVTDADREIAKEIAEFFFGAGVDISKLDGDDETLEKLTKIFSMSYFQSGFDKDSKLLAKAGLDVFTFILSHPPEFSLMDLFRLSFLQLCLMFSCRSVGFNPYSKKFGTCHSDDLNYIFPMSPPGFPKCVVSPAQKQVQEQLLDFISSFALSSRPSASGLPKDLWHPLDASTGRYLNIGADLKMDRDDCFSKDTEFWSKVEEKAKRTLTKQPREVFFNKIAIER